MGAISYSDIDGYRYKRDVLFCYDLKLPEDFVPNNQGKPNSVSVIWHKFNVIPCFRFVQLVKVVLVLVVLLIFLVSVYFLSTHGNGVWFFFFPDGEVESFKLIPVTQVMNVIKQTDFFKPNCCLVIIDFLVRHGYEDFFL